MTVRADAGGHVVRLTADCIEIGSRSHPGIERRRTIDHVILLRKFAYSTRFDQAGATRPTGHSHGEHRPVIPFRFSSSGKLHE